MPDLPQRHPRASASPCFWTTIHSGPCRQNQSKRRWNSETPRPVPASPEPRKDQPEVPAWASRTSHHEASKPGRLLKQRKHKARQTSLDSERRREWQPSLSSVRRHEERPRWLDVWKRPSSQRLHSMHWSSEGNLNYSSSKDGRRTVENSSRASTSRNDVKVVEGVRTKEAASLRLQRQEPEPLECF